MKFDINDKGHQFTVNSKIGGNGENEDLGEKATLHEFKYTPYRLPSIKGAVCYVASGMPGLYLSSSAYRIHSERSLWINDKGALGLLVGPFIKNNRGGYTWLHGHITMWTKQRAMKVNREYLIKFRIMLLPEEFAGATCVELNGDVVLTYVPGK